MIINGKVMNFDNSITILELLKHLSLSPDKVVVEINYDIVAKEKYETHVLEYSDKVEIVGFVGGG